MNPEVLQAAELEVGPEVAPRAGQAAGPVVDEAAGREEDLEVVQAVAPAVAPKADQAADPKVDQAVGAAAGPADRTSTRSIRKRHCFSI